MIELMLDDLGDTIFVNSVAWVPMAPLRFAVVCNKFVKIYDVPSDCIPPYSWFAVDDDCISSCVFATASNGEVFAIIALGVGRIAVETTVIAGPRPVAHFVGMGSSTKCATLSACLRATCCLCQRRVPI